jgi:8-oxo-dGTP pyrophosphatase MutT (NUDIX family)
MVISYILEMKPRHAFPDRLQESLKKEHPYSKFFPRGNLQFRDRKAAVLALVAWSQKQDEPVILLTQRAFDLGTHKGQIAFPGGAIDKDDGPMHQEDTFVKAALREAYEEMGIDSSGLKVVGFLPDLFTVSSNFWVKPVVVIPKDFEKVHAEDFNFKSNPGEIHEWFWASLPELSSPHAYRSETIKAGPIQVPTHVFYYNGKRIWGATGAMIKNLLERL